MNIQELIARIDSNLSSVRAEINSPPEGEPLWVVVGACYNGRFPIWADLYPDLRPPTGELQGFQHHRAISFDNLLTFSEVGATFLAQVQGGTPMPLIDWLLVEHNATEPFLDSMKAHWPVEAAAAAASAFVEQGGGI